MKKEVQGRWGRVATRCAAIAERDEDSRREDDIIMHKDLMICRQTYEGEKTKTHGRRAQIKAKAAA